MTKLAQAQFKILSWMAQSGSSSFAFEVMLGDPPHGRLMAVGSGAEIRCEPSDVRELEALKLIRPAGGGYELTNEGRRAHQELTNPPSPKRQPGFLN